MKKQTRIDQKIVDEESSNPDLMEDSIGAFKPYSEEKISSRKSEPILGNGGGDKASIVSSRTARQSATPDMLNPDLLADVTKYFKNVVSETIKQETYKSQSKSQENTETIPGDRRRVERRNNNNDVDFNLPAMEQSINFSRPVERENIVKKSPSDTTPSVDNNKTSRGSRAEGQEQPAVPHSLDETLRNLGRALVNSTVSEGDKKQSNAKIETKSRGRV